MNLRLIILTHIAAIPENLVITGLVLVDSTSMNEECIAVDAVGSMPKLQPRVDRQVCAVRFLT